MKKVDALLSIERGLAFLVSTLAIGLLLVRATHAGGLWRDECDFFGRRDWPPVVMWFRNYSTLFFFGAACAFLSCAVYGEISGWIRRRRTSAIAGV